MNPSSSRASARPVSSVLTSSFIPSHHQHPPSSTPSSPLSFPHVSPDSLFSLHEKEMAFLLDTLEGRREEGEGEGKEKEGEVGGVVILSHFLPSFPFLPPSFLEDLNREKKGKKGTKMGIGKGRREIAMGRRGGGGEEEEEKKRRGGEGEKAEEEGREKRRGGGGGGPPVVFWGFGEGEMGGDWLVKSEHPDYSDNILRLVSHPF